MEIVAAAITLAVITGVLALTIWYLRRIRAGRADPYVDPSWPTIMTELCGPHRNDDHTSLYHDDLGDSR